MRNIVLLCIMLVLPLTVPGLDWQNSIQAQSESDGHNSQLGVVRGSCTPDLVADGETATARGNRTLRLPSVSTRWDSTRVYRQAVILVSFTDTDFSLENPRETYDSMLNSPGFNNRQGPGCAAEYFREQSGGLFNVVFDVYGPVKVSSKAQPYSKPTSNTRNYGREVFIEATNKVIDSLQVDFSPYDWSGNGRVNQVVYVYAGITGNQDTQESYGHIWPNTSTFSTITTNGKRISNYTASAEQWVGGKSCGIGTILHEFTHSLGLPDIYPTTGNAGYSVVDEWDLMDGGNFTNYGWCPPNYTPMEKMLLGWLEPVDLTEPQTVSGMKPLSDGGEVYRIKHTNNEWLLLENRQQKGWDLGVPGKGLVIYHVDYDNSSWSSNIVNNDKNNRRFDLIHADNMDYDAWDAKCSGVNPYVNKSTRLNSKYLSSSPYPWTTDSTDVVNDSLTDKSVPPAIMNKANSKGNTMLSKSITNIVMYSDGTISFDFMADAPKCATPTVIYEDGRVRFECETEGATFVKEVSTSNVTESENDEIGLATQYVITVYAVAEGYAKSDVVTATLTWSDGVITGENVEVRGNNFRKGDVNEDGTVDVADISAVITIMAEE